MNAAPTVAVIGGGLAGISAAVHLQDRGFQVTLLEKRSFLGGRTYSVLDRRTGIEVDNGQHVFMRCCTNYRSLLQRLAVNRHTYLQPNMNVLVGDSRGRMARLASSALPAPFHLMPSFLRYPFLSIKDKALVVYGLRLINRISQEERRALDSISFYDWLIAHRQTKQAISNFWNLVIMPTLNEDVRWASAALAIMVFQEGLLAGRGSSDIGYATVGLSRLLAQAAAKHIKASGGDLLLGRTASSLLYNGDRIEGIALAGGEIITADFYACAVPHNALPPLLTEDLRSSQFFSRLEKLGTSPIVNVHLWYDQPVTSFDFAAFLDEDAQWIFNKGRIFGRDEGGYLDVSLSGARRYIEMDGGEIVRRVTNAIARLLPEAQKANLVRHLVIRQHDATFAPAPGCQQLRPGSRTPVDNLFLAGDWTDTGWPATMEGAVRSGAACAEAIEDASKHLRSVKSAPALNLT